MVVTRRNDPRVKSSARLLFVLAGAIALVSTLSSHTTSAAQPSEHPLIGSEDAVIVWLAGHLNLRGQLLPKQGEGPLDRATLANIDVFITADASHAQHWRTQTHDEAQWVFHLPARQGHNDLHGLKHQLIGLGCLARQPEAALALWQRLASGEVALPASAPLSRLVADHPPRIASHRGSHRTAGEAGQ